MKSYEIDPAWGEPRTCKLLGTRQTVARLVFLTDSGTIGLFTQGRVAQWLAQMLYTHLVGGSSPSSPTNFSRHRKRGEGLNNPR